MISKRKLFFSQAAVSLIIAVSWSRPEVLLFSQPPSDSFLLCRHIHQYASKEPSYLWLKIGCKDRSSYASSRRSRTTDYSLPG